MKSILNKLIISLALMMASLVGMVRGSEARQKWVFRIKSRFEEKRQLEEQKKILKEGGILLDEVEISAFHNQS